LEASTAEPLGTVDRYRLIEQVGTGGMSQVYKAWDTMLDREVAVKLLHPHLASKEDSRRRFSREAKAVAKLRHPNILEIFDFSGDQAQKAFIVTEFIQGVTLKRFAEDTGFGSPSIAALAAHALAAALEHAHALGIVHRDIKPENVMVRDDGVLKLMDFGIARVLDQGERMTMTGSLVGSPAHMAPEIIEGKEADGRADIFSLGTLLYWLCTGVLPFAAANTTAVLKKILDGTFDDPRILCPEVSDTLNGIIRDSLQRDPALRIASAQAMRLRLEESLREDGIERPSEELQKFFKDPKGYTEAFRGQLKLRLVDQARASLKAGHRARTLSLVNRLLAIDPRSEDAQAILAAVRGGERRRKLAIAGGALVGVVALAWGGWTAWQARPVAVDPPASRAPSLDTLAPQATRDERDSEKPLAPSSPPFGGAQDRQGGRIEGPTANSPPPDKGAQLDPKAPKSIPPPLIHRPRPGTPAPPLTTAKTPGALGQLQLFVQPFGDVYVDGQKRWDAAKNVTLSLPQGPHDLRLVNPNCEAWEQKINIGAAQAPPLRVGLKWKPALLRVFATPSDATVQVEDENHTPLEIAPKALLSQTNPIRVPTGDAPRRKVRVHVFKAGFRDHDEEIDVQANSPKDFHTVLAPL
jgi:serine/threonine-protein kinase